MLQDCGYFDRITHDGVSLLLYTEHPCFPSFSLKKKWKINIKPLLIENNEIDPVSFTWKFHFTLQVKVLFTLMTKLSQSN